MVLLSPDEVGRYQRYKVSEAARTFLTARVFLRSLLTHYRGLSPSTWRFDLNPWGRPSVAGNAAAGLQFNLSHKPTMVTCLLGFERSLGVDVEACESRRLDFLAIAERFFSPLEATGLCALAPDHQPARFFELWTLKESYIKARGIGLGLGLSQFSFTVDGDGATVRFEPGFPDDAARWTFRLFRPDAGHVIAAAVERVAGEAHIVDQGDGAGVVRRVLE